MEFNIPIKKEDLIYKSILRLFNFSLNLTENELDLLSDIFKNKITVLDKTNRKILREIKGKNYSMYSINNYIDSMKDKQVLVYIDNTLQVHPNIVNMMNYKSFTFNLNVQ